jgi:hypothetical protein
MPPTSKEGQAMSMQDWLESTAATPTIELEALASGFDDNDILANVMNAVLALNQALESSKRPLTERLKEAIAKLREALERISGPSSYSIGAGFPHGISVVVTFPSSQAHGFWRQSRIR